MDEPKKVLPRRRAKAKATIPTLIAPSMTKAKDGSQEPVISRNARTLAGFAICDQINPMPKIKPESNAMNIVLIGSSFSIAQSAQ
jgi:hypothetical protein